MLSHGDSIQKIKERRRRTSMQLNEQIQQRPNPNQIGLIVDLDQIERSAKSLNSKSQQYTQVTPTITEENSNNDNSNSRRRGRPSVEMDGNGVSKAIYDENGVPPSKVIGDRRRGRESTEIDDASQIWANDTLNQMTADTSTTWADQAIRELQNNPSNSTNETGSYARHKARGSFEVDSNFASKVVASEASNDNTRRRGRPSQEIDLSGNNYIHRSRESREIMDLAPDTPLTAEMQDLIERPQLTRQRAVVKERLVLKLKQRPSVEDTISRGILFTRPDTQQTYSLYEQHRALQKRRASLQIEKMLKTRPTVEQLHSKHIFYNAEQFDAQKKHSRKQSIQLNEKIRRRPSIEKLGMLFKDSMPGSFVWTDGLVNERIDEVSGHSTENEDGIVDVSIDTDHENEARPNLAKLFQSGPRTSKPLQESDFVDVQYDSKDGTIRMSDDRDLQMRAANNNNSDNSRTNDGRRGSYELDPTKHFQETYVMSNVSVKRVSRNLSQRPTIQEMQARGLLYDHPSVSRDLIERQHRVQRRRASQKIDSFLKRRPSREMLESKNIIYKLNETTESRRNHKRERSRRLEHYFKNERRDSNIMVANVNGVFVPYMKHMNNVIRESDTSNGVMHGGLLTSDSSDNNMNANPKERIGDLEEEVMDLKDQLKLRNEQIAKLKQNDKAAEIHELRRRMGGIQGELDHKNKYLQDLTFYFSNQGIQVPSSSKEMQRAIKKHLKMHLKQRPSVEELYSKNIMPDEFILRQRGFNSKNFDQSQKDAYETNKKIHFRRKSKMVEDMIKQRPTYEHLTQSNIIRETDEERDELQYFDATNRSYDPDGNNSELQGNIYDSNNVSIGRTQSGKMEIIMKENPNGDPQFSYKVAINPSTAAMYDAMGLGRDLTPSAIDDIQVLRNEVRRLHHVLNETLNTNAMLNRENAALKDSLERAQAKKDKQFGKDLNRYSISEIKATELMFEEQRISELENENTTLKSTVSELEDKIEKVEIARKRSETLLKERELEHLKHNKSSSDIVPDLVEVDGDDAGFNELQKLAELTTRRLSLPDKLKSTVSMYLDSITNSNNATYIAKSNAKIIETIIMELKNTIKDYKGELEKQRDELQQKVSEHSLEKARLQRQLRELKPKHKSSMQEVPNPFTFSDKEAALQMLNNPSARREFEMEREMKHREEQYVRDKSEVISNMALEIDRLRFELRQVGVYQEQRQKMKEQRDKERLEQQNAGIISSVVGGTLGYFTGWK